MSHHTAHPSARPAPFDATRGTSIDEEAASSWAALARLLSGRPWCRESRDANPRRRGSYLLRWQRNITDRPPAVPAAVPIYDTTTGTTRVFVVDLDTSRGGCDVVRRDASTITGLVQAAGGRVITDESPTGGIHVYIPLAQAVPFHDARDLALALARRLPSMDPSPNQNLQAGLIRPPGSRHRAGGYQRLHGPLSAAAATARSGNPHAVWLGLNAALASELTALTPPPPGSPDTTNADDDALPIDHGHMAPGTSPATTSRSLAPASGRQTDTTRPQRLAWLS